MFHEEIVIEADVFGWGRLERLEVEIDGAHDDCFLVNDPDHHQGPPEPQP